MLPPPLWGPNAVALGSGRTGFFLQPDERTAAQAATMQRDLKASFIWFLKLLN